MRGKRNANVLPSPGTLSTWIVPSCAGDLLRHRQTEAEPARTEGEPTRAVQQGIAARRREWLKDFRVVLGRDADTAVPHREHRPAVVRAR